MKPLTTIAVMLFALGVFAMPLTGCNTMEGAGEDVEAAGDSIEDAAE